MIILNNMYTGRYITEQGKLGHEAINLVKADDGNFYIWLNSMGVCTQIGKDQTCDVIMVRSINSHLYKVLAKAVNCHLCDGANIPRTRNSKDSSAEDRYNAQKKMEVRYNGKDPMDVIFEEKDMFATFWTKSVYEADGDIYLTNESKLADEKKRIYYADFKISEAMRAYIKDTHTASDKLKAFLNQDVWKSIADAEEVAVAPPEFNFFKLIRKHKDELSFSNALSYFIQEVGVSAFLRYSLGLDETSVNQDYALFREKHNIDLAFFSDEQVVIIENKIDAAITVNGTATLKGQIDAAVDLYIDSDKQAQKDALTAYAERYTGSLSQLSKYYLYAMAHLVSKGKSIEEIPNRIHCFLLIPKYAETQFAEEGKPYQSDFLFSDRYKIVTYRKMLDFFRKHPSDDRYIGDFISALGPLAKEFNNEIEEEVKYRFFKAIGKIK